MMEKKEELSELQEFFAGWLVSKSNLETVCWSPVKTEIVLLKILNSWIKNSVPSND